MGLTLGTLGALFKRRAPLTVALDATDDHPTTLDIRAALERGGIAVLEVGAPDTADAVVVHRSGRRDDLLSVIAAVRSVCGRTPLVAIWPDGEPVDERRALRAGVDCLVVESNVSVALAAAVHAACSGLVCLPRRPSTAERVTALSSREREVLAMLVSGATNAQIGRALYLAESTVKSHVSSAYAKLGVRSRKDASALLLDPWLPLEQDTVVAA